MDSRLRGNDKVVGEPKLKFYSHRMTFGHRQSSGQVLKQRFSVFQIFRAETFGKPVVNRREQVVRFFSFALVLPQSRKAGRGSQFPGLGLLFACDIERGEVVLFRRRQVSLLL